jgi:hypothetical protein
VTEGRIGKTEKDFTPSHRKLTKYAMLNGHKSFDRWMREMIEDARGYMLMRNAG